MVSCGRAQQPALPVIIRELIPHHQLGPTSLVAFRQGVAVAAVAPGLVGSLNRPDGNTTGTNVFGTMAAGKRLELLALDCACFDWGGP